MIWYVSWQNGRDNALLHLFYTSLFSITKTLAFLSEAMNFFSSSYFVCLLVSFKPTKTEQRQSCSQSAHNVPVWSSERQLTATKLPWLPLWGRAPNACRAWTMDRPKNTVETLLLTISTAICRDIPYIAVGLIESSFWRFSVDRPLMKRKHGEIPILFLDTLVTVIYRILPRVLEYKACQEPLFSL